MFYDLTKILRSQVEVIRLKRLVEMKNLKDGMTIAADIYTSSDRVPLVPKGSVVTADMIETLKLNEIHRVTIEIKEGSGYNEPLPIVQPYLNEQLREAAISSIRNMFAAIKESVLSEEGMSTAFQAVKEIDPIVEELVDSLTADTRPYIHILDLKSYDEYTYHHSLSVSVLSIAIGQGLGFNEEKLRFLGRCAMLHDIGKILIPNEIINKPSRLTVQEYEIIKSHTIRGYDYLKRGNIGDESLRLSVMCHHEKVDGSGYLLGLKGDKVPFMSQIVSAADIYDAITSYRSYRTPISPAVAIETVMGQSNVAFSYDIVKALIEKLELYPINSRVELSDGRRGLVVDNTSSMRPIVRIVNTTEIVDLMSPKSLSLVITRILSEEEE